MHCHIKRENAKQNERTNEKRQFYSRIIVSRISCTHARPNPRPTIAPWTNVRSGGTHSDTSVQRVQETVELYSMQKRRFETNMILLLNNTNSIARAAKQAHRPKSVVLFESLRRKNNNGIRKKGEIVLITKPKSLPTTSFSFPFDGNTNPLIRWMPAHILTERFVWSVGIGAKAFAGEISFNLNNCSIERRISGRIDTNETNWMNLFKYLILKLISLIDFVSITNWIIQIEMHEMTMLHCILLQPLRFQWLRLRIRFPSEKQRRDSDTQNSPHFGGEVMERYVCGNRWRY